jgi:hypothetical protein
VRTASACAPSAAAEMEGSQAGKDSNFRCYFAQEVLVEIQTHPDAAAT